MPTLCLRKGASGNPLAHSRHQRMLTAICAKVGRHTAPIIRTLAIAAIAIATATATATATPAMEMEIVPGHRLEGERVVEEGVLRAV